MLQLQKICESIRLSLEEIIYSVEHMHLKKWGGSEESKLTAKVDLYVCALFRVAPFRSIKYNIFHYEKR